MFLILVIVIVVVLVFGLMFGGWIIDYFLWCWVFLFNVLIGVLIVFVVM